MVVALNCGRDVARRRRRQSEKAPWLERTEMASGGEAGIDDRLAVVDLLASVTDRQREIIVLRYICQLRVPEIAALLQCAGEAALVIERRDGTRRLYRADHGQMDRLRQFLDEYWTESLQRLQNLAESAEREKGSTDG